MKTAPLKITATGTGQAQATKVYKVKKVVFVAAAAASQVTILDAAGNEWLNLKAPAADSKTLDFDIPLEFTGLNVTVLTADSLVYLYLE